LNVGVIGSAFQLQYALHPPEVHINEAMTSHCC